MSNFNTNENLKQLNEQTLIIGVDISKEMHVARAMDYRGVELGKSIKFHNGIRGFRDFSEWFRLLLTMYSKEDVIVGMEPTGPYGNALAQYLSVSGIRTVWVLGIQVKASKAIEDNNPSKNDFKDAKLIANLVKDGRYRKMREYSEEMHTLKNAMIHNHNLMKKLTRVKNQIHNCLTLYFPEFYDAFKDITQKTAISTLTNVPLPSLLNSVTAEQIVGIWRKDGISGGIGIKKATQLKSLANKTVGASSGLETAHMQIRDLMEEYAMLTRQKEELWPVIDVIIKDLPDFDTIMDIPDIGKEKAAAILAEIGDVRDFSHPKQLIRISGFNIVQTSSGKNRSGTSISKRGRPKLRRALYLAVLDLLKNRNSPFYTLHIYYTTRRDNPLKKMQSMILLCNKLLRVIFGMIVNETPYDHRLVLKGHPAVQAA